VRSTDKYKPLAWDKPHKLIKRPNPGKNVIWSADIGRWVAGRMN
jgi:hypothetical protein